MWDDIWRDGKTGESNMAQTNKEIDLKALNEEYQREVQSAHAENHKMVQSHGLMQTEQAVDLSSLRGTFCDDWPQTKDTLNGLLKYVGWLPFGLGKYLPYVARAQAAIKIFDKYAIPMICGSVPITPGQTASIGASGPNPAGGR